MKNILFISNYFLNNHIIKCIARDNLDCFFEILTSSPFDPEIANIKVIPMHIDWVDEFGYPAVGSMLTYAVENAKKYDFIFTFSNFFQSNTRTSDIKTMVLCPDQQCAKLESDKLFTKNLLRSIGIPTPKSQILDRNFLKEQLDDLGLPVVLKIARSDHRLLSFATNVFSDRNYQKIIPDLLKYTDENMSFFAEDFIAGREVSMHFLCNGAEWIYLGEARDYKKLFNNDQGINTDGIGSYSPATENNSLDRVFDYMNALMKKLNSLGIFYKGIMYLGVITGQDGIPNILEINTRPGYPEFLTIVNRLNTRDLLENFLLAASGKSMKPMKQKSHATVAVMIHHKNYDNTPKYLARQPNIQTVPDNIKVISGDIRLTRGNYWGIVIADADTKEQAADKIYSWLETQDLGDYTTRTDIGYLD